MAQVVRRHLAARTVFTVCGLPVWVAHHAGVVHQMSILACPLSSLCCARRTEHEVGQVEVEHSRRNAPASLSSLSRSQALLLRIATRDGSRALRARQRGRRLVTRCRCWPRYERNPAGESPMSVAPRGDPRLPRSRRSGHAFRDVDPLSLASTLSRRAQEASRLAPVWPSVARSTAAAAEADGRLGSALLCRETPGPLASIQPG